MDDTIQNGVVLLPLPGFHSSCCSRGPKKAWVNVEQIGKSTITKQTGSKVLVARNSEACL